MIELSVVVEALQRLGMSQRQIRALLGLNSTAWKERHRRRISADRVDRVAIGLGLLPVELVGFDVWCGPCLDDDDLAAVAGVELTAVAA